MKMIDDVIIIGIDSGYGNIKTANCCFPASVSAYDKEPVFKENLLVYESKFYLIGEGHKEFLADKTRDLDYYVLALAAIARELNIRKMTCGKIRIAVGLPLTWVSGQRDEFRDYLLQNKAVDFSFRNVSYHVEIVGVDVFPQGFAAVADRLSDFRGVNMICDIGNGTMNIMFINDKKPVSGNMFTEKYGTHQCLLAVRENVMRAHHTTVDEAIINRVFRFGTADIKEDYLKTITDTATDYVEGIFQRLREHEYNPELMRLYSRQGQEGLPHLCDGCPRPYDYHEHGRDRLCRRRPHYRRQQPQRLYLRPHPCGRPDSAWLGHCTGRSQLPVPRSQPAFQRFPDSGRRCRHHLCKGNPKPHRRLIRFPKKGRS